MIRAIQIVLIGYLGASLSWIQAEENTITQPLTHLPPSSLTPSEQLDALIRESQRYEDEGNLSSAIGATNSALERIGPSHFRRRELEHRLIDLHLRAGTLENLTQSVTASTKSASTALTSWRLLAEIHRLQGHHEYRRQALRAAYSLAPGDETTSKDLAEIESVLGNHGAAQEIVQESLRRRPGDVVWTMIAAQILVRQGQMDACEQMLTTLLGKHASDESIRNQVLSFYEANRMTEAVRRMVVQQTPNRKDDSQRDTVARWSNDLPILTSLADRWISSNDPSPPDTQTLANLAESMIRGGDMERAAALLEVALTQNPADPEVLRVLLMHCAKSGEIQQAIDAVDETVASDPALVPALDHQLFQLLGNTDQPAARDEDHPDSLVSGLMNSMKPSGYFGAGIQDRETELQKRWEQTRSAANAIRLALWQSWRNEPEAASATLRLALLELPQNIPLLTLQLEFAQKSGDHQSALEIITRLQSLQPEHSNDWESRRASILLDQEQFDEATTIFRNLTDADPNQAEIWMNLASAQQRAGNYYGALESWMTAFRVASPGDKTQIRAPVLAVIERLRLWDKGVDFLLDFAASHQDESASIAAYEEALTFAIQHDNVSYFRNKLENETAEARSALGIHLAKAELAKATGNSDEMLRWLAIAATQATDRSAVWKRVLDASIALNHRGRALLAATSLIQENDSPESWIQLAQTQESFGLKPEATTTWKLIKNRFIRDPSALKAAADFFDRSGDSPQARSILMAAAMINGATPETIYQAIELAMASGDRPTAITLCDRLLDQTPPLTSNDLLLPGASEIDPSQERRSFTMAMQAMGGLNDPESVAALRKTADSGTGDAQNAIRLKTIQTRGHLSQAGAERDSWSAWCEQSTSPVESVWAWYAMNRPIKAMDILETNPEIQFTPDSEQSFAWIALQGDQMERLRQWIDQSADDRRRKSEFVFLALSRYLLTTTPDVDRLTVLFPLNRATINERWQAAWLLAAHGHFQTAVDLATPALAITPAQTVATGAQTLASWNLVLRDTPAAIKALEIVDERNRSTLDQPAFDAWRMRWLLESDEGRSAMEAEANQVTDPIWRAGSRAMAAALKNDTSTIQEAADDLILTWTRLGSGIGSEESLDVTIRTSVSAALNWNLPALAFELTRASERASSSQAGLQEFMANGSSKELQIMSLIGKLRSTPPAQVDYQLAEYGPPGIDSPTLASIYRQLESSGHQAARSVLLTRILESHTEDPGNLYELAFALRRKGDQENEILVLQSMLAAMPEPKNFPTFADASLRLSELLFLAHRPNDAWSVIARAQELAPSDPRFAISADTAMKDLGEGAARILLWKNQTPFFPEAAAMWITTLSDHGEHEEIDTLLKQWTNEGKSFSPAILVSLIHAYTYANPDRASRWINELADQSAWIAAASAARSLKNTANHEKAQAILTEGVLKSTTPEEILACANALIFLTAGKLLESEADMLSLRAEKLAQSTPNHREAAHQIDIQIGIENPHLRQWLKSRLESRIRSGADPQLATIAQIQILLDEGDNDRANALVRSISDVHSWPRPALSLLANQLARSGQPAPAAHLFERLYEADPTQQFDAFAAATQLWHAGERHRSRKLIEPFIGMRWLDPVLHKFLARYIYETGDPDQAREWYSEVVAQDPGIRTPEAWAALARIYADHNDFAQAEIFLNAAYSNPEYSDVQPLVDFITNSKFSALNSESAIQRLSRSTRTKLHLAVIRTFLKQNASHSITAWLSPEIAQSSDGLRLLDELAQRTELQPALETFWDQTSRELPTSRALKNSRATFLLTLAQKAHALDPSSDATVDRFHHAADVAPWRFDTSGAYAQRLIERGNPTTARSVIKKMLASAPTADDRHHAHEFLDRLNRSDDLINHSVGG